MKSEIRNPKPERSPKSEARIVGGVVGSLFGFRASSRFAGFRISDFGLRNFLIMHLSPRELDKLTLHQAGFLAQKRLARGLRLNHPEAVALIATVILEFIRDGKSVAELMNLGRELLGRSQVMTGVPEMIYDVQVEGTFPDGSKLVTVHHPIASENGDLKLALHGSFLPVPDVSIFKPSSPSALPFPLGGGEGRGEGTFTTPGSCEIKDGEIELNTVAPLRRSPSQI
jgi:urease subunit gamma/beta